MIKKDQTDTNNIITHNEFSELANFHDQHCISIYIPTSRAGEEVDQQMGQLTLKNCIKEVKTNLEDYKLNDQEINSYLQPVINLLDNKQFWRNQSDCLSIFLSKQQMKYYTLPIDQDKFTYVSDHFYLMPIMPLFNGDGKFYLMSLSLQDVKLYEGTRHSISEVYIEDLVPGQLEEVVGYDYQNKSLQFRSGQGGNTGAMFHGQGAGKDDKGAELEKFFREVDKSLMKILKDEDAPLILACVDHYLPIYSNITNYSNLFNENISGNNEETYPLLLHEMAWSLIKGYFQKHRKKTAKLVNDFISNGKTSFDLDDIIPAAIDGRIEVLFIQNAKDKFGLYDMVNRSLIVDETTKISQASLYNLAAVQTWIKGGNVYMVEKNEMPIQGTSINALFRY